MPQSIYFKDTEYGKEELEKSKKIYNSHKNLTLIARETVSYEIMKKEFPKVNVILTPDIVMYLNKTQEKSRKGIIFALRRDVEKVLTDEQFQKIDEITSKYFENKTITDTRIGEPIYCNEREEVVEAKFEQFRNAELVITDRLHGMIFSVITSTPCIALGNYNHKIESSFEWLKNQGYIRFLKSTENIEENIKELKEKFNCKYNNEFAITEHKKILDIINN